jgi:hypothetical protein
VEFAIRLVDRQVVDRGEAPLHQPASVELPILVAVGSKPLAAGVTPFVGEADRDPVAVKSPEFLDQPIFELFGPLAVRKPTISRPTEFGAIPPSAIDCVGE